jgi:3D (Asp-Asp-Asp) domain-containing protein
MLIRSSFWRKAVATLGAAVGFVFVYETTIRDSRYAARQATMAETTALPQPGSRLRFTATAYCKGETTASGVSVRTGIAAADPALLPVGTVIRIDTPDSKLDGIWTIMDTGPSVQGRTVDLYLWSCHEALRFGRRPIQLEVLRLGWNPQHSQRSLVDDLFKQREQEKARVLEAEPAQVLEANPVGPPPVPADALPAVAPAPPSAAPPSSVPPPAAPPIHDRR